jgi:hypothetical protein
VATVVSRYRRLGELLLPDFYFRTGRSAGNSTARARGACYAVEYAQDGPSCRYERSQHATDWRSHGNPYRLESFKISNDPEIAEELEDVIGRYLNPPDHALALCKDEKSQIRALDPT